MRYLLGYSTITINVNSAKYLSDTLFTLLQLKEIVLIKQILKHFREDLLLLKHLFQSSADFGAGLA